MTLCPQCDEPVRWQTDRAGEDHAQCLECGWSDAMDGPVTRFVRRADGTVLVACTPVWLPEVARG